MHRTPIHLWVNFSNNGNRKEIPEESKKGERDPSHKTSKHANLNNTLLCFERRKYKVQDNGRGMIRWTRGWMVAMSSCRKLSCPPVCLWLRWLEFVFETIRILISSPLKTWCPETHLAHREQLGDESADWHCSGHPSHTDNIQLLPESIWECPC